MWCVKQDTPLTSGSSCSGSAALAAARLAHPERFGTHTDPKLLALPENAWINQPETPANQAVA